MSESLARDLYGVTKGSKDVQHASAKSCRNDAKEQIQVAAQLYSSERLRSTCRISQPHIASLLTFDACTVHFLIEDSIAPITRN